MKTADEIVAGELARLTSLANAAKPKQADIDALVDLRVRLLVSEGLATVAAAIDALELSVTVAPAAVTVTPTVDAPPVIVNAPPVHVDSPVTVDAPVTVTPPAGPIEVAVDLEPLLDAIGHLRCELALARRVQPPAPGPA